MKKKKKRNIFLFFWILIMFFSGLIIYLNQTHGYFLFYSPDYNETYVSLRFDDGLKSQLLAFDLIEKYNLTGSVYIITSKITTTIPWEKEYYLDLEEIQHLSDFIEIGAHTVSHVDLTKVINYR
jgi:peptidoglycan/xylan/chitin deacetylase (PgdA/CDA1 family)